MGNWQITGGTGASAFAIDARSGQITIAQPSSLDFAHTSNYTLMVAVGDGTNMSRSEVVTIEIPKQVQICYRGQTRSVPKQEVPGFLRLGASIGRCRA